jgi:hypothetical protein
MVEGWPGARVGDGDHRTVGVREFLATPAVAAVLGLVVGVALISATALSRKLIPSADAQSGVLLMMVSMFGGMVVASIVLFAYALIAPQGFLWFGLALGVGFITGLAYFSVQMLRES